MSKKTTTTATATTTTATATTATATIKNVFELTTRESNRVACSAYEYGIDEHGRKVFNAKITDDGIDVYSVDGNEHYTFTVALFRAIASHLRHLERLTGNEKKELSKACDNCLVKLFNQLLKSAKEMARKEAFERSGVKFAYGKSELRFKPHLTLNNGVKWIIFKSLDRNAIIGIWSETIVDEKTGFSRETMHLVATGKGGNNRELYNKFTDNNLNTYEELFKPILSGTWDELYTLCTQVDGFTTCAFPAVLKDV